MKKILSIDLIIYTTIYSLCKMKNKIPPTCLQGSYRNNLGEFSIHGINGRFGAERVNY